MKISCLFLSLFSRYSEVYGSRRDTFARYDVIMKMIQYYSPGFDERQYFQYGCHCIIRQDDLQSTGMGKPVDALDAVCRKFKNCQKVNKFGKA